MRNFLFKKKEKSSGPIDFLIVGLGNPGKKYEGTRHNVGFAVLEKLADELSVSVNRVKYKSFCSEAKIGGKRVLLMMPQTYMNLSGDAVIEAMNFYKLSPEQVIVIFDDVSLDVGIMRIRKSGSDGGQKGIRSIIERSGSDQFPRIKIGVGAKPHPDYDLADWVLSKFSKSETKLLLEAVENAVEAIQLMVSGNFDQAMSKYSK